VTITRKKQKSKRSADRILGSALASCQKNVEEQRQLAIAKREGDDNVDDDVVEKAQTMISEEAPSKKKQRAAAEESPDAFGHIEGVDDSFDAKEHRKIKIEASETQQTEVFGTKRTASLTASGATPKSSCQALSSLQSIIVLNAAPKGMSSALKKALTHHLENGTIHWFLTTCQLCKNNKRFGKIPSVLLDWLVAVAVVSAPPERHLPSLVHGAFATLERVLKNPSLHLEDDCNFSLRDLSSQLEKWLGASVPSDDDDDDASPNNDDNISKQESSTKPKNPPSDGLAASRFLRLWELAFAQQRVHVDSDLRSQASSSIVRLLVLGLDETFASCRT
jgi:hypothetical protein